MVSNRNLLFQGSTFRGYVSFREGTGQSNTSLGCHKWFRFAVIHICESILFLVGDMLVPWNFICNVWYMCVFSQDPKFLLTSHFWTSQMGIKDQILSPFFSNIHTGTPPKTNECPLSLGIISIGNFHLPTNHWNFQGIFVCVFRGVINYQAWSSVSSQTWGKFQHGKVGQKSWEARLMWK